MIRSVLMSAFLAAGLAGSATAETITVCAKGCDYTSINAAIDASSNGDVIQLSAETYFEGEKIDTDGKAITLRGVLSKAGEPASVLDGAGTHRVLICQSGETSTTVFQNLVIQNGYKSFAGGGMYNDGSSPTLTNCTFESNSTVYGYGGGMYNSQSSPILTDCTFAGNSAVGVGYGGGMYNGFSSPTLTDCTFTDNTADDKGGGMYNYASSPTLTNCTFSINSAGEAGGGMGNRASSPTLTNCTFNSNSADDGGGGMYNYDDSSPTLTDCNFCGNINPSAGYDSIAGDAINGRSSGNNLLEGCVVGDINFDGDYDEDDIRLGMADFGITECTPGDMDGDDDADAADFALLRNQIGVDNLGCVGSDINGDGEVNGADMAFILSWWGVCSP
ncbi:right-handed parallel beta-helix repeat-containing protein [bacterium]|nr:right-handed parallel beta-helix repeat-containing protein [bacterium]